MNLESIFLRHLCPRIYGWFQKICWKDLGEELREELQAEAIALGWKYWLNAVAKGNRVDRRCPSNFARLVVLAALNGRRAAGGQRSKDAYAFGSDQRDRPAVYNLVPDNHQVQELGTSILARDTDNPADLVQLKLDSQKWRNQLSRTQERILNGCLRGETTNEMAEALEVTPSAISQQRAKLHQSYVNFTSH